MHLPWTLSRYFARHFLVAFLVALLGILVVIGLIELVELIRRASYKDYSVPFHTIVEMTLLKLPSSAEKILPFAVMVGAMTALSRLTRSHELIVTRASGVSVWQFLMPLMVSCLLLGVFFVTVFNPVSAAMITRFEAMEGKYITGKPSVLSVFPSGLWLRQVETTGASFNKQPIAEYIMYAQRISQQDMSLSKVTLFMFDTHKSFIGRVDAPQAMLKQGFWELEKAQLSAPNMPISRSQHYTLKTDLSMQQIQESFASPKTLSFWELPNFIAMLEKAGFSALRHKLYWHTLLSTPIMLCAMACVAALFSLQLPRYGKTNVLIFSGVVAGFVVYFLTNLVNALGFSGSLPVYMAAWIPPVATMMLAGTVLLHIEDG